MMIPIPRSGVLRSVEGVAEATAIPGVDDIRITAMAGQAVRALPEGASYLGFIFARADRPDDVEHALRAAHAKLVVNMSPLLNPVA
jgi:2-keto-3-deoxy-L-rhamnonate aldolase RhmA